MHLEDIRYLVCTIEQGSINRAAKELELSQPALSIALNKLEQELNITLLKRSYKGVTPTENGEQIYREAQIVLEMIDSWYQLAQKERVLEGDVHILAVSTACDFLMNTLIPNISVKYPKIPVFLHECHHDLLQEKLLTERINIGILSILSYRKRKRLEQLARQGWHAEILYEEDRELIMSTENPLCEKEVLTTDDLQTLILACYATEQDSIADHYKRYFRQDYRYHLNNLNSILQLVATNQAVAIYPPKILQPHPLMKAGKLVTRPIRGIALGVSYLLLYPFANILSHAEKEIITAIKETFHNYI